MLERSVWRCLALAALAAWVRGVHSSWIDDAERLPVRFAQVREDPVVERDLVELLAMDAGWQGNVLSIASGGDTAAYLTGLASSGAGWPGQPLHNLTLVDVSEPQLALSRRKLESLACEPHTRLAVLGHRSLAPDVAHKIKDRQTVSGDGDGRYERLFDAWRRELDARHDPEANWIRASVTGDADARRVFADVDVRAAMARSLCGVMTGANLARLFGPAAANETRAARPFCQHFATIVADRLQMHADAARDSPWAAQLLTGHFASPSPSSAYPWFSLPALVPGPSRSDAVTVRALHGTVDAALADARGNSLDAILLSNVLDWVDTDQAHATLTLAHNALRDRGAVLVRQLNSRLNVSDLLARAGLQPHEALSARFHAQDRSLFYSRTVVAFKSAEPQTAAHTPCDDPLQAGQTQGTPCDQRRHITDRGNQMGPAEIWTLRAGQGECGLAREWADDILHGDEIGSPLRARYLLRLSRGEMTIDEFRASQCRFRLAVDHFAPSMALLWARLDRWEERAPLVANIDEEHGHGHADDAHPATFRRFLRSIGAPCHEDDEWDAGASAGVRAFNAALGGLALLGDRDEAIGAFASIEFAFANISTTIGNAVLKFGWADHLVHYSQHAWLDQDHANQFFRLIDRLVGHDDTRRAQRAFRGLRLGAHIFRHLYDHL